MALQTWVARFVVDHGRVTEEGGRLRTFQRRRLDEPDVDLHILAEPQGTKGGDLAAQALEAIGRLFLSDRLSLTGGLARAIRTTHQTLLDWNRRSLPNDQAATGIAGAIVSGPVVYLAQIGPTLVYLRRAGGRLERLQPDATNRAPLGEGEMEPAIRRIDLADGDILMAASVELSTYVDDSVLTQLLDRGTEEALPELYLFTRDLPEFALFLINCTDVDPADTRRDEDEIDLPPATGNVTREQALPASPDPSRPPPAPPAAPPPSAPTSLMDGRATTLFELPPPPPTVPVVTRTPALPVQGAVLEADAPRSKQKRQNNRRQQQQEETSTNGSAPVVTAPEPEPTPLPPEPFLIAPSPVDISRSVVRLRNDNSIGRGDYARTTGSGGFRVNLAFADGKLLRIGAILAVVVLIIAFVPGLVRQKHTEQVGTLLQNAQSQLTAAGQTADPAAKRKYLEETRRLASEVQRIEPDNAPAADIRNQATTALNGLDAIFDLGAMKTVTTLSKQVTGEVSVTNLIVAGGTAYMLDSKGGRILAVTIGASGAPATLYQDGESYRGTQAKRPMYMTWESQAGRLLVLDADRKLFAVRANDTPEPLPLRRSGTWASLAGMAAYDGNLYVLDPKGKQIYRYLPAAAGFDSEPGPAITGGPDLTDAQGIAVDVDIFVIGREGSVRRFKGTSEAGFPLSGLDRPIKGAVGSIALLSAADEVYIADSGNKRIVVTTRDGVFKRQLVSNAFTDVRSISLDPATSTLYAVVGDALLSAPLPKG